jgi:hypothetical protein
VGHAEGTAVVDLSDEETLWVNVTNIVLAIACVVCWVLAALAVLAELLHRLKPPGTH